jgi:hypothetical protein
MPNNHISTERNKGNAAYFSQNGNSNKGTTKLITPQMQTFDHRNKNMAIASSTKNSTIPP